MELRGRTALITGGAVRVGAAIALELAGRGANIVVSYRTSAMAAARLVTTIGEKGGRALAVQGDISSQADVLQLSREARNMFGSVDVLVNNASVYKRTPLAALTEADWDASLAVNLKGPFLCSLEFGRLMTQSGGGAIVNIADWAVERPYVDYLPYLTAKGGLITMTKAFARELAPTVRVNAVAPGPISPPEDLSEQEIAESRAGTLVGRWGSPTDIARAVAFLVEGSDFITGAVLPVDGGRLVA